MNKHFAPLARTKYCFATLFRVGAQVSGVCHIALSSYSMAPFTRSETQLSYRLWDSQELMLRPGPPLRKSEAIPSLSITALEIVYGLSGGDGEAGSSATSADVDNTPPLGTGKSCFSSSSSMGSGGGPPLEEEEEDPLLDHTDSRFYA